MSRDVTLQELWADSSRASAGNWAGAGEALPETVGRYLDHAIAVGTPLASAVRLRMHGEIKVGRWTPFSAEQVICENRGMIWAAKVSLFGLPLRGSDRVVDGVASMRWKLFGFIPIINDSGEDVTRSTLGRLAAELVWLPSALSGPEVAWGRDDRGRSVASFELGSRPQRLCLETRADGQLTALSLERWGNPPEVAKFEALEFGGVVEAEATFGGYTIPTKLRIGWYPGSDRFEKEGEFFRVTVDEAEFR